MRPHDSSDWMKLRWQSGSKYYEAHLHQTLFGDWVVSRVNGTVGESNSRVRHIPTPSYIEGINALISIAQRRLTRKYYYVPPRAVG